VRLTRNDIAPDNVCFDGDAVAVFTRVR